MSLVPTTKQVSVDFFKQRVFNKKLKTDTLIKVSAVLLVRKKDEAIKFYATVIAVTDYKYICNFPFAFLHPKNPEIVVIYPNIRPYLPYPIQSIAMNNEYELIHMQRMIRAEKDDAKKKIKWETITRGTKFLLKKEYMSIYKFLTAHLTPKPKDDVVRDIALEVIARTEPAELIYCKTPDEYVEQHKVPTGSCMQWHADFTKKCYHRDMGQLYDAFSKKYNGHPSVWYNYCPEVQGIYIKDTKGLPSARCFLYGDKFGGVKGPYSNSLRETLTKSKFSSIYGFSITKPFNVPSYEHEGDYYCPLPHMDDISKNFSCRFNESTKEFEFKPGINSLGYTSITDTYKYKGYINKKDIYNV